MDSHPFFFLYRTVYNLILQKCIIVIYFVYLKTYTSCANTCRKVLLGL